MITSVEGLHDGCIKVPFGENGLAYVAATSTSRDKMTRWLSYTVYMIVCGHPEASDIQFCGAHSSLGRCNHVPVYSRSHNTAKR